MSMAILVTMIVSCEEFECWGDITNFPILLLKLYVGRNCLKIPGWNIIATFNYDTFTKFDRKMSKLLFLTWRNTLCSSRKVSTMEVMLLFFTAAAADPPPGSIPPPIIPLSLDPIMCILLSLQILRGLTLLLPAIVEAFKFPFDNKCWSPR